MNTAECIEQIEQPEGGYIPPETLEPVPVPVDDDDDGYAVVLNPEENVSPDLINTAVDHMTRFGLGLRAEYAFTRSLAVFYPLSAEAWGLIPDIKYINDDNSIINALRLSEFDFLHFGENNRPVGEIDPDEATIENVKIMVDRSCLFFGVCVSNLFNTGFMTFDTLWNLSTSEVRPTKKQTLRLLVDWRMGLDSAHAGWFQNVKYLGIYNPRLNEARRISVDVVPKDAIDAVENALSRAVH